MTDTDIDQLTHYGIRGMRWGFRRGNKPSLSSLSKKSKKEDEPDTQEHLRRKELGTKKTSTMTNKEMQELITRMNLERQLSQLKAQDISPARKLGQEILREVGKELIKDAVKTGVKGVITGDLRRDLYPTDITDLIRGR